MTLNQVIVTGQICFPPKTKLLGEVNATSAQLDIGDRNGDVQLYGLGEAARRMAALRPGQNVKISGQLSVTPSGVLQVKVIDIVLVETQYREIGRQQ